MGGRSLPHAVLMMIPEPWENHTEMSPERRAFYQFHSALMEPWDGPALIAFTDGSVIGAVLDRNGLRPGRYWVTSDGLVVLASEVGVLDIDPATVIRKGRFSQAGSSWPTPRPAASSRTRRSSRPWPPSIPTRTGCTPASSISTTCPIPRGVSGGRVVLPSGGSPGGRPPGENTDLVTLQRLHGYTEEELRIILTPMARAGTEPIGSMGTDTPVAVLSDRPRLVFDYFTQLFAQVTNPPLDAIREELVTSLGTTTGPEQNLLEPIPASCRQIVLPYPVISDNDLAKFAHINDEGNLPDSPRTW